ncbi:lytic transglycosylase domain-containing protein [Acerihabitans sp. TG2]|uniref:lytic transglycosylase domain-containing protein n=1 Tax=Acerihabitans sp. TG2 TaxID=3096008 RepID=UPI002B22916A|nr:lytic transglycosylase domain-containing protein [Acerihabitans sp. TG2]MEA9392681.1 lytic transglycosylase domain-containing protein [Acerihabitans sp. TG2]
MKWFVLVTLAAVFSAQASPDMCFTRAGHDYGIDPLLLTAISIKESRLRMNAINGSNRNLTEDVCGMQVNSSHYPALRKFDITRERLLKEPCTCIYTGAWVLAHIFRSYGKNWDSVGMYNTGPSTRLIVQRRAYATDIKNIYRVLLARQMIYAKTVDIDSKNKAENTVVKTAMISDKK